MLAQCKWLCECYEDYTKMNKVNTMVLPSLCILWTKTWFTWHFWSLCIVQRVNPLKLSPLITVLAKSNFFFHFCFYTLRANFLPNEYVILFLVCKPLLTGKLTFYILANLKLINTDLLTACIYLFMLHLLFLEAHIWRTLSYKHFNLLW